MQAINGNDIRNTKVNNNSSGEGLLYFPYLGKRIPVEWNGNTIVKGEGDYGCITTGIVQAQGSDASILTNDLQRQITALYNSLNEPGSYSGTFGQAIEAMKTKAQELLDKIARGETPTKEDYKGYKSICKAIDKGLNAWKAQLDEQYGGINSDVPAIKQLYNDIAAVQADILKDVDCDGTGYRPALRQETDLFYASLEPPKTPIHIPDLGGFLLTKCNLELGKANALKLSSYLTIENELKNTPQDPNKQPIITAEKSIMEVIGQLTQLQLTTSYETGHFCADYRFSSFKDEGCLFSTGGNAIIPKVVYYGKPTNWQNQHPLWLIGDKYWVCQYSDDPVSFKYYDAQTLKWYDLPLPKGQTAGEAFGDAFANFFVDVITAPVVLEAVAVAKMSESAKKCFINATADIVIQSIINTSIEAVKQGHLGTDILPSVLKDISFISAGVSCGTGLLNNCGDPCMALSAAVVGAAENIFTQYKAKGSFQAIDLASIIQSAGVSALAQGILSSGISLVRLRITNPAVVPFALRVAWLQPKLLANIATYVARSERMTLASSLSNASVEVLNALEDPAFFKQFIDAVAKNKGYPESSISGNLAKFKAWVQGAGNWIIQRTNFWDGWISKCFPGKNWSNTTFQTIGKDYNSFKYVNTALDNEMRAMYTTPSAADNFLPGIVNSGSTNPVKVLANQGEKFYKIVPKGSNINEPSPYYLSEVEYQWIKENPSQLEQKLGLPLSSVNAEYDVFTITSQATNNKLFQSTIAPTKQFANTTPSVVYNTTGGKTQSLIINNGDTDFWLKSATPIESLSPNSLPVIGN